MTDISDTEIITLGDGRQIRMQKPNCPECIRVIEQIQKSSSIQTNNYLINYFNSKYELTNLLTEINRTIKEQQTKLYHEVKSKLQNDTLQSVTGKKALVNEFCTQIALLSAKRRKQLHDVYDKFTEHCDIHYYNLHSLIFDYINPASVFEHPETLFSYNNTIETEII